MLTAHDLDLGRALFVALGLVVGAWLVRRDSRHWPLPTHQTWLVYLSVLAGGIAGACFPLLVAWAWPPTAEEATASVQGALVGGFVGVATYKRTFGIVYDTGDAFARSICHGVTLALLGTHWLAWLGPAPPPLPLAVEVLETVLLLALAGTVHNAHLRNLWPHRQLFLFVAAFAALRFLMGILGAPRGSNPAFSLILALGATAQVIKRTRRYAAGLPLH